MASFATYTFVDEVQYGDYSVWYNVVQGSTLTANLVSGYGFLCFSPSYKSANQNALYNLEYDTTDNVLTVTKTPTSNNGSIYLNYCQNYAGVRYLANGGIFDEYTKSYNGHTTKYGQLIGHYNNYTMVLPQVSREGYILLGYYLCQNGTYKTSYRHQSSTEHRLDGFFEPNGTETYIGNPGSSYTFSHAKSNIVNVYCKWADATLLVVYNTQGGLITSGQYFKNVTKQGTYGEFPTPTRDGYSFAGWWTKATGGTQVTASTTVPVTEEDSQVLYARWTAQSVYITATFDGNGGTIDGSTTYTKQVLVNSAIGTLPTPTRSGFTFEGWEDNNGNTVTSATVVGERNVWLYAQWSGDTYTLTFNANGGSVDPTTKTCTVGKSIGALPTPARNGWTFNGWYTALSGGIKVTRFTKFTSNTTVYAHWTASSNDGVEWWEFDIS